MQSFPTRGFAVCIRCIQCHATPSLHPSSAEAWVYLVKTQHSSTVCTARAACPKHLHSVSRVLGCLDLAIAAFAGSCRGIVCCTAGKSSHLHS